MPKFSKAGSGFALQVSEKQLKELELEPEREYEIVKARKGLYVIIDRGLVEEQIVRKVDEKILALLENSKIQDRVEERFEKFLNKIELLRFNEMLKEGIVEKFKASEKYKKAVYKLKEKESQSERERERQKGWFVAVKGEGKARELNGKYWRELKEGELKGLKDFDNTYYIFETGFLQECSERILKALQAKKTAGIEEITALTGLEREAVKGACAFLKENGELFEKKQGIYQYIQ
ncbi:MAG TPA: hypothetical protein HA222_03695 [Candidatus Diapherotrites archaeon]|uniref:Uncharacterized protein n=1 Tax=Candidatus Iainarchaeum sp. TaxID=3101447 RepID=A0A7J4L0C9_9ARCH|nr:hypothetical protein [Candidatus Diapherotrites archaeon]HIH33076.1 hypothetical protein [Candidatus Diapherotrites archaeon]